MIALSDMDRHFTEVSSVYRDFRTTDPAPVERIALSEAPALGE